MKSFIGTLGLLAAALLASLASATPPPTVAAAQAPQPNWYNVELIVFRDTDPNAGSLETWPADPGTPDWNGALPFNITDSAPPVPFQALQPASEQLGDEWTRLKRSKNYAPLLHVIWTQPVLDRSLAQPVRIGIPPSAAPASATHPLPVPAAGGTPSPEPTPAYGTARLSTTGPYLHFDLDLVVQGPLARSLSPAAGTVGINTTVLAPPGATAVTTTPAYQLYRLQQDRRVDGGKLTYFDHPLFGVILLVTPVRHSAAPVTTP